jgi:hypothetical protein
LVGGTVDILVGPEKKLFSVHEVLLRSSSSFFDTALSGSWKEVTQRKFELPADEPKTFKNYVHWLYYGDLYLPPADCSVTLDYMDIAMAYVLGDKLQDRGYRNAAVDSLFKRTFVAFYGEDESIYPDSVDLVSYVYENTMKRAWLWVALVDLWIWCGAGDSAWLRQCDAQDYPHDFLHEISVILMENVSTGEEPYPPYYFE